MGARVRQQGARRLRGVAVAMGLLLGWLAVPAYAGPLTFVRVTDDGISFLQSSDPTSTSLSTAGGAIGCLPPWVNCLGSTAARGTANNPVGFVKAQAWADLTGQAGALANAKDLFTLSGGGPGLLPVTARITVDGSLEADAVTAFQFVSFASADTSLVVGFENFGAIGPPVQIHELARTLDEHQACFQQGCPAVSKTVHAVSSFPFSIAPGVEFLVAYQVNLGAAHGAFADFGATARLSFLLPDGTSITSVSGFSQSSEPPTVPEPSTLVLLGSSLAGLAALRARAGLRHLRGLVKRGS